MYNEQLGEVYERRTEVKTTFRTKQSVIWKVKGDANKSLSVSVSPASFSVYHVFPIDWMCSLAFILSEAILVFRGSASSSENLSINPEH